VFGAQCGDDVRWGRVAEEVDVLADDERPAAREVVDEVADRSGSGGREQTVPARPLFAPTISVLSSRLDAPTGVR
jgi:hypothetical protein